ncbi:hypothetical protein C8J57DRAFT_1579011 [Mycena rebaudengoi]|nr:hypothetical protein C8J57DRAFT_1579011 [Mycena rebaudengoi]
MSSSTCKVPSQNLVIGSVPLPPPHPGALPSQERPWGTSFPRSASGNNNSAWRWSVPCPGIPIEWDAETFWTTYPFQLHAPGVKERPKYDLLLSEFPKARSPECLGALVTADGLLPCSKCSALTLDVAIIKERASRSYEQIRSHDNLNSEQLRAKLAVTKESVNALKLNNLNLNDSLTRAQERLSEWQEAFHFIGQNSIPALHRLLANAEKEGWSAKKLLHQSQLANDGKYTARNYTQYDIDLAILLYELGGGGAVYAMNHSIFALPSRNTIQPYRQQHNLMPSVSGLKLADISSNISALFGSRTRRDAKTSDTLVEEPPTICGHTLSFDELATERKIDYMTETDEMGGFCLEHVSVLETVKVREDTRAVEAAVTAVKDGKVHISHETCVGAISRLSETGYGAKPVFMGPSCKKGSVEDCLRTMEAVLEAWKRSPDGEPKHGPILSIASDGDHKRRLALFFMCMHSEILPGNPLYPFVRNLPGLNRRVGKDNLTNDSDPKHLDKRICTLICSTEGLVVKNVCINRDLILPWLERLPEHDWSETSIHSVLNPKWCEISIQGLLNPKDAQDVPRAIKLMLCVVEISQLDSDAFDPSEAADFEALCLLGELFDALLQPFINTELSLSEQIESLIKASHLLCALYIQNGTSFMSNQLYADLQAMIKNAILMVPKTRLINGKLKVFICLLGDDVLEALFGRSRMIGGHSPNCSIGELRSRFGSAMTLDYIYEQHPELERQPRRLNMFRMRHVDHLRPAHFKKELRADSCDLDLRWVAAVKAVDAILAKYGVRMPMSFAKWFEKKDTDLMRPLGGKYLAITAEADRSVVHASSTITDTIDPNTINPPNLVAGVDFDAMIASEVEHSEPSPSIAHSHFAKIDTAGHLAHKKTVVRTFFDMTQDNHGSHDRLQRIRGFTIGGKSWTRDDSGQDTSTKTHFQLGNLFTSLICHNGTHIGLAIAKCTLIKRGASPGSKAASVSAIPHTELHLAASPYTISGQVLCMTPLAQNGGPPAWTWNGEFVSFSLKKRDNKNGDEVSRLRNLQFSVSSRLIDCHIHEQAQEITAKDTELPGDREKTWRFTDTDLRTSWNGLWNRLLNDSSLHDKFPIFTAVSDGFFPYESRPPAEFRCYASPIADTAIEQSILNRNACRICQKSVKDQDRQAHVGQHIMRALCGVEEHSATVPVSNMYPCGTCGGSSCKIGIKGGKADSDCPSAYPFMISAARKFLPTRPCTNIPIECQLDCRETHWKYNFPQHLAERHPGWRTLISPSFVDIIRISDDEQLGLKIPADKIIDWLVLTLETPQPPKSPNSRKRSATCLQNSPSRHSHKENEDPNDARPLKKIRLTFNGKNLF